MTAPYGPPPALGRLVVDCSYHPMVFGMPGARVTINGQQPVKVPWGPSPFDLPAGSHHVRVSGRWLGEFGAAELFAVVYPGQVTTVYYRPSTAKWMRGSIGFTPQQKTRGIAFALAIPLIVFVVVFAFLTLVK